MELRKASWLDESAEDVKIPVGGGEFSPSGFVGPLTAGVYFTFYSDVDLAEDQSMPQPVWRQRWNNGAWTYYYISAELGATAAKAAGKDYATQNWVFQMPRLELLNVEDPEKLKGFGDAITLTCQMTTYASKKYRHGFHLITLPSVVAAMASWYGLDVPKFDISPLIGTAIYDEGEKDPDFKGKYILMTDEFQTEMIGGADEKDMKKVMAESFFGKQRTEIWKALGESDPLKYTMNLMTAKGTPSNLNTEAPNLQACLKAMTKPWSKATYGRMVMAVDPRMKAGREKDGVWQQATVAAVLDLFENKVKAQEAAQEDLARFKKNGNGNGDGKPSLPVDWKEIGEVDFLKNFKDFLTEHGSKPAAVFNKKAKDVMNMTPEQVEAWKVFVK